MKKELSFVLPPEIAFEKEAFKEFIYKKLDISENTEDITIRQTRRSLDARQRDLKVNVWAEVFINEKATPAISYKREYLKKTEYNELLNLSEKIGAMLWGIILKIKT